MKSVASVVLAGLTALLVAGPAFESPATATVPTPRVAADLNAGTTTVPRFAPTYMAYGDRHVVTEAEAVSLARRYDVIAATMYQLRPHVAAMKAANPRVVITGYVNGGYSIPSDPIFPESVYAHDAAGKRITTEQYGNYLMDPSNPVWQQHVIAGCQRAATYSGYDGCFLDSLGVATFLLGYSTGIPINVATGAAWDQSAWVAATSALTNMTATANPGQVVLTNGLNNGPCYYRAGSQTAPLADVSSAALAEIFLRTEASAPASRPIERVWAENVDMLVDAEARGNSVLTTTKVWNAATAAEKDSWHRYALSSFLLGSSGRSFFNFSGAQSWAGVTAESSYESVDLGRAVSAYAKVGGIYQRTFQRGLVLVNPTTAPVTVRLAGTYRGFDRTLLSGSITLAPGTGDALTSTDTVVGVPSVTTSEPTGSEATTRILTGAVNPTGQDTTWAFDYGSTQDYTHSTPATVARGTFGQQPVTAAVAGLEPGTTYHYRLRATNGSGAAPSVDATFTTPPLNPTVATNPVGTLADTSAALSASIGTGHGQTTWWVEYGTTYRYGSRTASQVLPASTSPAAVNVTISALAPVTNYRAKFVVSNASGTVSSSDRTFKTLPQAPVTRTLPATSVRATTATLQGTVNPGGGHTEYFFEYGATTSYGVQTPTRVAGYGAAPVAVSASLLRLTGGSTYHVRLVATNASGTTRGDDVTVTTTNAAPVVTSPSATDITARSARLRAQINPSGQVTTYRFQYGRDANYGSTTLTGTLPATEGARAIVLAATGLSAGSTYHYRVVATNGAGTSYTSDATFRTTG